MEFNSYNFKLIVINELIELGLLKNELKEIYKKQEKGYYEKYYEDLDNKSGDFDDDFDDDFFDEGADDYYLPHPEMEEEIANLDLTEDKLAKIEKIDIDYGEIQGMLAPHWHGEDELFYVSDLSDVKLLPNLKEVKLSFALDPEITSLKPLLQIPQLKKVTTVSTLKPEYFFSKDKTTRAKLEEKGIKVVKGK